MMKDEEINARFYELGRRIAELDPFLEKIKSLEISSNVQSSFYDKLKKDLHSHHESIKNIEELIHSLELQISQNKILINQINEDSFKGMNFIHGIIEKIQKVDSIQNSEIENLKKVDVVHEDFSYNLNYSVKKIKEEISEINLSLSSKNKDIERLKTDCSKLNSIFLKINEIEDLCKSHNTFNCKNIYRIECELQNLCSKLKNEFESCIDSESSKINQKINSIKIPDTSHLAEKSHVESLLTQIQCACLDSKNALLKSGNLEVQNQISSKKLENISLTLQKIELSKQAL